MADVKHCVTTLTKESPTISVVGGGGVDREECPAAAIWGMGVAGELGHPS